MFVELMVFLTLAQSPAFEVASVKPVLIMTDTIVINLGKVSHGEVTLGNASLADCLKFAYGFTSDIQLDGPNWIGDKSVPFDIVAKAAPETPREQLLIMLQGLLTDRFRLEFHHEQRPAKYLALTDGKKGLKIQPADPVASQAGNRNVAGSINSSGMYLQMLARLLSRFLRQPVLDETGLPGLYAIRLEWTPESVEASGGAGAAPTIYTAVQEQLGLRLEARKGPIDVLVIDKADRTPVAN